MSSSRSAPDRSGPSSNRRRAGPAIQQPGLGARRAGSLAGGRAGHDDHRDAGQRQQDGHRRRRGQAGRQAAGQHRAGDISQVEHGRVQGEGGLPEAGAGVSGPQAAHARAERRIDQSGRDRGTDEQPGRGASQRTGQQGHEGQRIAEAADGGDRDEPPPVREPAADRPGRGLAQRVAGHDQAGHRHRGVLGRDQQQRNPDHALRQPGAHVSGRQPARHRLGEQLPVGRLDGRLGCGHVSTNGYLPCCGTAVGAVPKSRTMLARVQSVVPDSSPASESGTRLPVIRQAAGSGSRTPGPADGPGPGCSFPCLGHARADEPLEILVLWHRERPPSRRPPQHPLPSRPDDRRLSNSPGKAWECAPSPLTWPVGDGPPGSASDRAAGTMVNHAARRGSTDGRLWPARAGHTGRHGQDLPGTHLRPAIEAPPCGVRVRRGCVIMQYVIPIGERRRERHQR